MARRNQNNLSLKAVNLHRPAGRRILGLVLLGAVLVGAQQTGLLKPLNVVADYTIVPVGSFFSGLGRGSGGFFGTLGKVGGLASQNTKLEQEVADLRRKLSEDAELKVENSALRKQLDFKESSPYQLVTARVVGYQPDSFRQFLTINRGSADGIKVGMPVASEGSLVGKISEVSRSSSKVFLVSDPDFRVAAIAQESRAAGVVRGQIGGSLLLDKVAQSEALTPGDTAITSGLGEEFPRGLIIGRIESVSGSEGAVFQSAKIAPSLRFTKLNFISVMIEAK